MPDTHSNFETSKVNQVKDQIVRGSKALTELVRTHGPGVQDRILSMIRKAKTQYDQGFGKPKALDPIRSIAETQHRDAQTMVRDWLGQGIGKLVSSREQDLLDSPKNPNGYLDRMILFHLKQRAIAENDQDFLEGLHHSYWAELEDLAAQQEAEQKFLDFVLAEQAPELEILHQITRSIPCQDVVDIGCGAGLFTNYVKNNFGPFQTVSGIDLNMRRNLEQAPPVDPEIKFYQSEGLSWVTQFARPNSLFISNGGVLEYFSQDSLNALLKQIASKSKPAVFFANEPIANDHNYSTSKTSIPFGDELSLSHNYTQAFEANQFQIVHQRSVVFGSWKILATIAVTV